MAEVRMATAFWIVWAEIAKGHAVASECAYQSHKCATTDRDEAGQQEFYSGLQAICAAAFALDAACWEWGSKVIESKMYVQWKATRKPFKRRFGETLKRSVTLTGPQIEALLADCKPMIRMRGDAVHYVQRCEEPVQHRSGLYHTAPARVEYGGEAARAAVTVLQKVYRAVKDYPKPKLEKWSHDNVLSLEKIIEN